MKTLKDVKVGETATVARLHGEGPVKRRIMDMGITKGVEIYVRKVAPLGDPMEPSPTMSAVTNFGRPIATTRISASRVTSARFFVRL